MILIQRSSKIPCVIVLNSVSGLERATNDCFLLFQVTRSPPKKVQYAMVDHLSIMDPTQSASV